MEEENRSPSPGDVMFGHVPDWLNSGFFEKALRDGLGDPGLRVSGCEVKSAIGKGENYVSVVYAAKVTTAAKGEGSVQHHLIIKCLPSNKARKMMSNKALARFHAFSYALKLKEPEVFRAKVYDLFPETMFSVNSKGMIEVFVRNAFQDTAAVIREWADDKYDVITDWMDSSRDGITGVIIRLLSPDDPGAVLNHGDFWTNNMLFRHSSEGPEDNVKLLDFQISRVCSPAADLSYLMTTSITAAVCKAHWDNLLRTEYLRTFWDTLGTLGARNLASESQPDLYSWPWLQSEILRFRPFALVTAFTTTQVILTEESHVPDMDSMTEEQLTGQVDHNPFSDLSKGKQYQVRLRGMLDGFLEEGLFQRGKGPGSVWGV
ncbi:uncharacterized protein [Hetaerina americana]|uniref:uncharacterized protein isoform X2 n=1 Tax=Hetaerina americana TaxID=62018 RepID=UPI003A7F5BB2